MGFRLPELFSHKTPKKGSRPVPKSPVRPASKGGPRPWSIAEVRQMRQLAIEGNSIRGISLKMGRSTEAIIAKATEEGIALPGIALSGTAPPAKA